MKLLYRATKKLNFELQRESDDIELLKIEANTHYQKIIANTDDRLEWHQLMPNSKDYNDHNPSITLPISADGLHDSEYQITH
jgi:hypothetical protein